MSETVSIVAALIRDEAGRVLLVRKRGTLAFMQPGGKRDPGEDDTTALARELHEELGCRLVPGSARPLVSPWQRRFAQRPAYLRRHHRTQSLVAIAERADFHLCWHPPRSRGIGQLPPGTPWDAGRRTRRSSCAS